MRLLEFGKRVKSAEECGCGFKHDKTLKAVIFGPLTEALKHLEKFGLNPPYAVFSDKITYEVAGRIVQEELDAKLLLVKSPTFQESEEKARELGDVRTLIAVGGGTVIDVAKYAAYLSSADFVSIPTAPSHDGIVSPITSLFTENRRKSILTRAPSLAIIDLSILTSAPRELIASGYGDVLAKIVSLKDWQLGRDELGEAYCKTAEELILEAIELVIDSLDLRAEIEERVARLIEALINCGVAMMIVGSSRPASGSEHLISHYLDMSSEKKLRHGIQCAIGALAMAAYHELRNPNWWKNEKYRLEALREHVLKAGIPARLEDAGIPVEVMINAITNSWRIRPQRYTILHKFKPDRRGALQILRTAGLA